MIAVAALGKEREKIQLDCSVPVEQLGVGLVFFEELTLNRVAANNLTVEVIVLRGILGIHQWSCGVGFKSILEHAPVGIVTVDDTRSHVEVDGEKTALGGVHHRSARTVFLTVGTEVDTVGIAVVGTHTVVAALVAAAHGECVLHGEAGTGHGVEPVEIATEVYSAVAPSETHVAVVLGAHHVNFLVDFVPGESAGIRGVDGAVLAAFLGCDENHTIGTARTIYSRCRTVLKDVERGNVVGVDVGEVATGHSVNHNQRAETCRTG